MQFQPSDTLRSRTYIGLIIAQFLAAFNDQAIHASSMFYAIHRQLLTEAQAISLMPILFFAPWAIFCTLAGYLADRYSKRSSLVAWKLVEIGITLTALAGFCVGTVLHSDWGPVIVLSTVFLMGMHSAFFVPAKYGAMPEILQPHLLSKGNGILESTSFLAVILGTVCGGILSDGRVFQGREYWIGIILTVLAVIGAVSSLLIRKMPAANPTRPFPRNLFKPLADNLRVMIRSRPLALAVLGIAFFTFMVAFMRATMYMHGEVHNPRWSEFQTSLVVATVALGVGLGSPLAGNLSGGKVELGLVPLGSVGMIVSCLLAAGALVFLSGPAASTGLIVALILIGFGSGFYIVPFYTLLQHRAPKTSKGDLIATSNFINVTGAIAASVLFFALELFAHGTGITPRLPQRDNVISGELVALNYDEHGRPDFFEVASDDHTIKIGRDRRPASDAAPNIEDEQPDVRRIEVDEDLIEVLSGLQPQTVDHPGSQVVVSTFRLRGVEHYRVRAANKPMANAYDNEPLPRYLFIGASLMTLGILILLCRQLPDFFVRALLWLRSHGRYRLKVVGLNNLPSEGPVILATNCDHFDTCMQVVTATDRFTRFILLESDPDERPPWLLRYLARRTGLVALPPGERKPEVWDRALAKAAKTLGQGNLLGVTADGEGPTPEMVRLLDQVRTLTPAPILPVYCGELTQPVADGRPPHIRRMQVVIGYPLRGDATPDDIRRTIHLLGEWMRQTERDGVVPATVMIPKAVTASPTATAPARRAEP
jgi:MFS family permease